MRYSWLITVLMIVVVSACGSGGAGETPVATVRLEITALAGPVCPVEADPPSPDCAPRAVEEALIVVTDSGGSEVAHGVTGPDGRVVLAVAPGALTIVPQPVDGLLGTAAAVEVTATDGQTVRVTADYDTGIR